MELSKEARRRVFDAAWQAVLDDDRLQTVRRKLSIHELRLIIGDVVEATLRELE